MEGYMKSMREKITRMLIAGALLLLTVPACVDDRYADNRGGVGDGETLVKFSVWLPGNSSTTRALTADEENHVETIDILIFEQGGNWVENVRCSGSDITDITPNGSNISKKSFTIKMHHGTYDMVMLGNARELVSGMNMSGKSKSEVLVLLTEQMPTGGKWIADASDPDYKDIPMWGDIGNVTIDSSTQNLDAKDIHLTRMLARVDVQIATGVSFILTSVDVYNYNTEGAPVPATVNWDNSNNRVNAPTIPSNSTLTKGPLEYNNENSKTEINVADNKCAMEIYLFEAENHTGTGIHTTGKELLNRTCIVVGGRYGNDSKPTYYRADFSTGTGDNEVFLDVLRNHHYTFNITKVGSSGHDTSEGAFEGTQNIDFTVEVSNWGDNLNVPLTNKPERWARSNIVWDGSKLTFAATQKDNETIPASSQGVFFKWGSLVAVSPVGVIYNTGQILFSPNGTNNYTWVNIPYVDETTGKFATYDQAEDDFYNYNDGSNTGGPGYSSNSDKGDICRYISARGWVEGNWRLPTQAEYNALIAEIGGTEGAISNGGNFVDIPAGTPDESNKYGSTRYGFWQPVAGRWLGEGAVKDKTRGVAAELVPGGSSVYFAVGGFRNSDDGNLARIGLSSSLWSASSAYASSGTSANYTNINATAASRSASARSYGMPVRCIRDDGAGPEHPMLETDYDGGKIISTDGETYTINVTSNIEWEATVLSGTDKVTSGDTAVMGDPLLNANTGFGGVSSSVTIIRSGDNTLNLITEDYSSHNEFASGDLGIVFYNKATGAILHEVTVKVVGRLWARSNIVWDGSKLTFAVTPNDNTMIPANVQGVFFKWGSLVAISPLGATYNTSTQTLYSPSGNAYSAFDNIPYIDEMTAPFNNNNVNEDDFATYYGNAGYNVSTNKGDICRYITAQGWVSGKWRLPTAAEYNDLIAKGASQSTGSFGVETGNRADGFWQPSSGRWLGSGAAADSQRGSTAALVPGSNSIFFPAGDHRNYNGTIPGTAQGFIWLGSSYDYRWSYNIGIRSNVVDIGYSDRGNAFPVRCIRNIE